MSRTNVSRFCLCLLLMSGCSGDTSVPTAALTGEVKRMNGEPVGQATVVFYPEAGPSAVAQTDAGGVFNATVAVGSARVAVVANATSASEDTSPEALAEQAKNENPPINTRFASPDSSGLSVKVESTQSEKVVFVVD